VPSLGDFHIRNGRVRCAGGFFRRRCGGIFGSLRNRKGSYLNIISAGFALELFLFLEIENTDFLFPSFRLMFFQALNEGNAQDFIIPLVSEKNNFSLNLFL